MHDVFFHLPPTAPYVRQSTHTWTRMSLETAESALQRPGSTEVFLIIISLCTFWRSLLDLGNCVLADLGVFWGFFGWGEYVCSPQ